MWFRLVVIVLMLGFGWDSGLGFALGSGWWDSGAGIRVGGGDEEVDYHAEEGVDCFFVVGERMEQMGLSRGVRTET